MGRVDFEGLVMEYLSIQDELDLNAQLDKLQLWKGKMEKVRSLIKLDSAEVLDKDL